VPLGETRGMVDAQACRALGDAGVLVELGSGIDLGLARRARLVAGALRDALGVAAHDVVPAYGSVLVRFDPLTTSARTRVALVEAALKGPVAVATGLPSDDEPSRTITVGVCFGGPYGLDFEQTAHDLGMRERRMRELICQPEYRVCFLGFLAGFPYLLGLADAFANVQRLLAPRPRVPMGSVAIASGQCGIYPRSASGGWRLLGRTAATLFDPMRLPPALFRPGDAVRFEPVDRLVDANATIA
jgi:KipI family sensor histidine kinase inhibitor